MFTRHRILFVFFLTTLTFAGCQKTFEVTFANGTDEDLQVTLNGPGDIEPDPPTLPVARDGGRAMFIIEVYKNDLPANYRWIADGRSGSLPLSWESKELQAVTITDSMGDEMAMD